MKKLSIIMVWVGFFITIFLLGRVAQERVIAEAGSGGSPFGIDPSKPVSIVCGNVYPTSSATYLTAEINGIRSDRRLAHNNTPWAIATFEKYYDSYTGDVSYKFEKFGCYTGDGIGTDGKASYEKPIKYVKGMVSLAPSYARAKINGQDYASIVVKQNNSWINACFVTYQSNGVFMMPYITITHIELSHFGHSECN